MTVVKTVDKVNTIEFQQIDRIHKFKVFIYNLSNQLQNIRFDGSVTVLIRLVTPSFEILPVLRGGFVQVCL